MIPPQIADLQLSGPQPDVPIFFPDHPCPVLPTNISIAGLVAPLIFGPATIVAVGFRFWAHRRTKAGIAIDAYLILVATIIAIGICVLTTWASMCGGLGWPLIWLSSPAGLRFQKSLDGGQILWGVSIACIRASILCFYRRIFTVKSFRTVTTIVLAINASWLVVYVVITGISYTNHGDIQYMINFTAWLITNGCLDILQDVIVLCLPLLIIPKLKMSRHRKIGLAGLFWLGAFCVVASIVRLILFVKIGNLPDTDRFFADLISECAIWTTIQPCTSIIAACLPTYGPLLRSDSNRVTHLFHNFKSFLRSSHQGTDQSQNNKHTDKKSSHTEQEINSNLSILHSEDGLRSKSPEYHLPKQVFELESGLPELVRTEQVFELDGTAT